MMVALTDKSATRVITSATNAGKVRLAQSNNAGMDRILPTIQTVSVRRVKRVNVDRTKFKTAILATALVRITQPILALLMGITRAVSVAEMMTAM